MDFSITILADCIGDSDPAVHEFLVTKILRARRRSATARALSRRYDTQARAEERAELTMPPFCYSAAMASRWLNTAPTSSAMAMTLRSS